MPTPRRPNVVLLMADDQRFDTIHALGCPAIHTPNLDALAQCGVAFTQAHIPGSTHGAVCMPARAMLWSGRSLFHLQNQGAQIPAEHITLGECFQNAGYQTIGVGKWHADRAAFARTFSSGDEIFFGGMWDHWNVPAYHFDPTGQYAACLPMVEDFWYHNTVRQRGCDHVTSGVHSTDLFTNAAIKLLHNRDRSRPFLLSVAFLAPHDPRTMPESFRSLYDPEKIALPANFAPAHTIDTGTLQLRDELLAPLPRTPADTRRHIAEYYAMISHLDAAVGRLRACLEELGEWDNTIFVHMADHGLAVGQHGLMGKQNLYDHSVRIPLLLSGPGLPRGQVCRQMVYALDVNPTLCQLAGITPPPTVDGQSLCGVLRGDPGRDRLYLAYCQTIRGIKTARHKLIEYNAGGQRATQVFNLEKDPLETTNLAADESLLATLRRQLLELRDQYDDLSHPLGRQFWTSMEFR